MARSTIRYTGPIATAATAHVSSAVPMEFHANPPVYPPSSHTTTTPAAPARPEVRVFNISTVEGAAEGVATRLRDADWNVAETGNLEVPDVTVTTVYFGETEGEQQAAEEVGRLLEAPVAPRVPALVEQPPGVVVLVTG